MTVRNSDVRFWGVERTSATNTVSIGQLAAVQTAARSFGVEVSPLGGRDARDIELTVTEFAGGSNRGLITAGSPLANSNRDLIILLAARHRLPAVYPYRFFVTDGGLISYGPDSLDPSRLCRDCQKASGGAYAPLVIVPKGGVQMHGELRYHQSIGGSGKAIERGFCPNCGSQIALKVESMPDVVGLQAGSLADPSRFVPAMDVFTDGAQPWDYMQPERKKFPQGFAT
jgi:hypothetical protein